VPRAIWSGAISFGLVLGWPETAAETAEKEDLSTRSGRR
jgi:hypothetical protein